MIRAALAIAAMLAASPAAAQRPCLNDREAEAMALVALPEIVTETGRICAGTLPATSLVRRTSGPFLAKYRAEADRAWPAARAAIVKLSDPATELLLLSDYARPLLTALAVPQIVGQVVAADCPVIDRFATSLEPLPARNVAALVITTLRFLQAEKARGRAVRAPDLPLCAVTAR